MRKIVAFILTVVMCLFMAVGLTACNAGIIDLNLVLNYVVTEENGNHILHKVEKWYDSNSDSAAFKLSCCGNYVWTSSNVAVAYTNKPADYAYDFECGDDK